MPRALAFCPQCGAVFPSPINIRAENITLTNISVTCPRCGADGQIPSGVYSALTSTTLALTSGRVSPEQLKQLIAIFESARSKQDEHEDVAKAIEATVPELSSLSDTLPRTRLELYAFVATLAIVLPIIIKSCDLGGKDRAISEAEVQQIVDQAIEQSVEKDDGDG